MSEQQYDIIFRGDIVLGQQLAEVKLRLQQLFKTDATKIDSLFIGRPVPLKRNLDLSSAQKYRDVLIKVGAQVELVVSVEATPAEQLLKKPVVIPAPSVAMPVINKESAQPSLVLRTQEDWSLAPVGTYLLPAEKSMSTPHIIDTSTFSLRPEGGNLVDVSEKSPATIAPFNVPNFKLAEVGADLVRADEKLILPIVEIDVGDWDIAELGVDLITADEKEITLSPLINILDVGLAPVGTDLGQIKSIVKPVTPDISKLRLAE